MELVAALVQVAPEVLLQAGMGASAVAPGQSPRTHLLMGWTGEGYRAVAMAMWMNNMVRCVTWET